MARAGAALLMVVEAKGIDLAGFAKVSRSPWAPGRRAVPPVTFGG